MTGSPKHTVVVGGGVIGVCCAYYLSLRGARVTLVERDEIGLGASFGNGGVISPGHPPINKPGRILQAIKWMFDETAPLHVPPRFDPGLARWLWRFRAYCTEAHLRRCMDVMGPLGHVGRPLFDALLSEESLDCDFRPDGYYEVYRTQPALEAARHEAARVRDYGYRPEVLDGESMLAREPALKSGTLGGIFHPDAATLNPHRFVLEMADRARRRGARILTGAGVARVSVRDGRATGVALTSGDEVESDAVVLATGAYSPELAGRLGIHLPIQPAKGYHRDRDPGAGGAPPLRVACVLGERFVFCTPMDGFVRFAGTLEFSGINDEIRRPRLEQLTESAKEYMDGVGDADSSSEWCGLRPCTPDGLPVIGPAPGYHGLFVANGHAMLGITLGPITGKLIAEYVVDGRPSVDVSSLGVRRA